MHRRFMTATEQPEKVTEKVSLPTLTAMVVGSMIGSGVFLLPRRFGLIVLGAVAGVVSLATGAIEI
jgi:arginine:ornithine antiporter / lysine permease